MLDQQPQMERAPDQDALAVLLVTAALAIPEAIRL